MSGLNSTAVITAAIDHAATSGLFESVQGHEAMSSPGNGLTADLWVLRIRPLPAVSGLNGTSALLVLQARVYLNANTEPADAIDPRITDAVDTLLASYSAGFTLGGLVMEVDLLGEYGTELAAEAGYITVGGVVYRCMTITVPCVLDNAWPQAP